MVPARASGPSHAFLTFSMHVMFIYLLELTGQARVKRIEVERNRYKIAEPAVYLGGALPGLLGSGKPIRRRALLIACSYPPPKETNLMIGDKRFLSQETDVDLPGETPKQRRDNRKDNEQSRTVDLQRALPNTIVDLKKVYDMLLNCRGFVPDEIVVLTDADDENELVRSIKDKGTRVEYSGSENVLRWMCRLASGLGVKAASFEESGHDHVNDVATSLFLYFGGHGSSRPEFGSESLLTTHQQAVVGTEEDLRDEMLMLSDYQRVRSRPTAMLSFLLRCIYRSYIDVMMLFYSDKLCYALCSALGAWFLRR